VCGSSESGGATQTRIPGGLMVGGRRNSARDGAPPRRRRRHARRSSPPHRRGFSTATCGVVAELWARLREREGPCLLGR
jgi:hypothetical protein